MSNAWAGGSSRHWRTVIRPFVLARDEYRCRIALPGMWRTRTREGVRCLGVASQAHHLHGKARCAGCRADQVDHLVAACAPCNLKVGDPGARPGTTRKRRNAQPKTMTQW